MEKSDTNMLPYSALAMDSEIKAVFINLCYEDLDSMNEHEMNQKK